MNLYNEGGKLYVRSLEMTEMAIDQAGGKAISKSAVRAFFRFRVSPIR